MRLPVLMRALEVSCWHAFGMDGGADVFVDTVSSVPACLNGTVSSPSPSSNGEAMGETCGARCVS